MSDQTQETEVATPEEIAESDAFDRLYVQWHRAMAAANDPDLPGDDEAANARYDAYNAAERALFRAQAPRSFDVWRKWEVLDYLVTCEVAAGRATDAALSPPWARSRPTSYASLTDPEGLPPD